MAKGIAIVCVVIGHCVAVGSPAKRLIYTFHMPLFFILAGCTFRLRPLGEELRRSSARLLVPYALLFLVGPVKDAIGQAPSPSGIGFAALARSLAGGSGFDMPDGTARVGIAWFLAALFCARLLMCLLGHLFAKIHAPRAVQGAACIAVGAAGLVIGHGLGIWLPLSLDVAMVAVPLMWLGMMARGMGLPFIDAGGNARGAARSIALAGASLALWALAYRFADMDMADRLYRLPVLALAGALAATYAICTACRALDRVAPVAGRPLARLGRLSFLILCVHAVDWVIPWTYLPLLDGLPHPNLVAGVLRTAYCVAWAELAARVAPRD